MFAMAAQAQQFCYDHLRALACPRLADGISHSLENVMLGPILRGKTRAEVQRVLRVEQWLTSRDRRGPASIPKRKEVTTHEVLNA